MKPSEALRKGAEGQTQITGDYFAGEDHCCALGAIMRAIEPLAQQMYLVADTRDRMALPGQILDAALPEMRDEMLLYRDQSASLYRHIVEWNDGLHFTFDQIIQELESYGY